MNTRIITILVVVGLVTIGLVASLIESSESDSTETSDQALRWHFFDEGAALAQQTNKKLLIDVYTDWCAWCKKMDKEVYTNQQVKDVLQSSFVAVKLNAESSKEVTYADRRISETSLARQMGVSGYPTTVFLDSNAQPITKVAGYIEGKEFVRILRFIGQDHYKTKTYQEYLSTEGSAN
ncbi:MAG: thioredoxin fold domain-containing protein [Bacteroidota bacterium]